MNATAQTLLFLLAAVLRATPLLWMLELAVALRAVAPLVGWSIPAWAASGIRAASSPATA
jgi:hypothetical protein